MTSWRNKIGRQAREDILAKTRLWTTCQDRAQMLRIWSTSPTSFPPTFSTSPTASHLVWLFHFKLSIHFYSPPHIEGFPSILVPQLSEQKNSSITLGPGSEGLVVSLDYASTVLISFAAGQMQVYVPTSYKYIKSISIPYLIMYVHFYKPTKQRVIHIPCLPVLPSWKGYYWVPFGHPSTPSLSFSYPLSLTNPSLCSCLQKNR